MKITAIRELIIAPGKGTDAANRFLTVSPSTIVMDKNLQPSASSISIEAWEQKGGEEPHPFTGMIMLDVVLLNGAALTRVKQGSSVTFGSEEIPFEVISYIDVHLQSPATGNELSPVATVGFIHGSENGTDASTYYIVASPTQITKTAMSPSASSINVRVYKATGSLIPVLFDKGKVIARFMKGEATVSTETWEEQDSFTIDIGAQNLFAIIDRVELDLYVGPHVVQTLTVSVMNASNRIPIPEGVYDDSKTYVCNSIKTPLVLQGKNYYYLQEEGSYTGEDPSTSATQGGAWAKADGFQMVIAEMLFSNFGKLASAVFSGDYMYSQYGNKGLSAEYTKFDSTQPFDSMTWKPNLMIDFLRGEIFAGCGATRFKQDGSGQLAGGNIKWDAAGKAKFEGAVKVDAIEYRLGRAEELFSTGVGFPGLVDTFSWSGLKQIELPKASEHVGLELTFFCAPFTTKIGGGSTLIPQEGEFFLKHGGGYGSSEEYSRVYVADFLKIIAVTSLDGAQVGRWIVESGGDRNGFYNT